MGRAWERLVRSSEEIMFGLVKDHVLTDSQLYTFLTEVEHIINRLPLTHLSKDIDGYEPTMNEYLPSLNQRPQSTSKPANLEEGQLVLMQDDDVKRTKWPLGRLVKTMPGKDEVVRVVEVHNRSGAYTRPVSKVFKLEDDFVDRGEMCVTRTIWTILALTAPLWLCFFNHTRRGS